MSYKNTDTPCIGICSTVYGDDVCRGCKRTASEVISWNTLSHNEKSQILERLNHLVAKETAKKLTIVDSEKLRFKCIQFKVRFNQEYDPYCWAYALLRHGADKIRTINNYGIEIKPEFSQLNLLKIYQLIDDAIFNSAWISANTTEQ
jgi:hypothetical protein